MDRRTSLPLIAWDMITRADSIGFTSSGMITASNPELPSIMSTRIDYSYSASSYNELKKIPEADLLAKGYNAGRLYRDLQIQRLDKVSHYTPGFSSSCTLTLSYGFSRGKGIPPGAIDSALGDIIGKNEARDESILVKG
ncbi:unnamed protein product [Vicia faba]|uniref:Uncharacterized protein n=1 Tax=Vicia faba TaxID=3906 RepID=A0AAV1AM27_VICFA|nr:unnamed protein product [Vicia faba]